MNRFNRKYIVLGFLIAMGFGFELVKGLNFIQPQDPQVTGADLAKLELRPFLRPHLDKDRKIVRSQTTGFRLSGRPELSPQDGKYDSGDEHKKNLAKKKKKLAKKKKKKKKKNKAEDEQNFIVEIYGEDKDTNDPLTENSNTTTATYNGNVPPKEEKVSEEDKWKQLLLVRPDREAVTRFVREYQSGRVEADVFYNILNAMLEKDVAEFHGLAVWAAGLTPSLQSYNFLVAAYLSANLDRDTRLLAKTELSDYQSIQHLWVPRSIVDGNNNENGIESVLIAAASIERATDRYLKAPVVATPPGTDNPIAEDPIPVQIEAEIDPQLRRFFNPFVPVLQKAIKRYQARQDIVEPLETALGRIQKLEVVAATDEI